MSNPGNDNRLEQLSREAASGYTPPGNASWEKMEAALDKVMPVEEKRKRRIIFWWLLPLAIIGTGLVYFVWPEPEAVSSTKASSTISASSPAPVVPAEKSTADLQETTAPEKSLLTQETNTDRNRIRNSAAEPIVNTKNKIAGIQTATAVTAANQQTLQAPANNRQQTTSQLYTKDLVTATETVRKTTDPVTKPNPTNSIPVNTIQPTADSGSSKKVNSIMEKTDTATRHEPVITDSLQTDSTISKPGKTTNSKFSIAFVAGMDASTVKYKYSDKAGINIGILAGYHFNDHWSMHTGVLFTKKNYTVAGEDFQVPKNSWLANYKLAMVDGYCNMWEVPLFVRYQFNASNKRSFFLSSGISSYFMTRENYNYAYYSNGQLVTRNNNYPTGNTHLFSILRLSAGWKKSIGKSTSVLIEPYAALPLGGVGFGNIRLSSYGLNFSLQIRQPSKKK